MADALKTAGGSVETMILEDCDHLEASLETGNPDGPWAPRAAVWMREQG